MGFTIIIIESRTSEESRFFMAEFHISGKVGGVFLIVGVSIQSHAEIGRNDHQEGASHFIILAFLCLDWTPVIFEYQKYQNWFYLNFVFKIRVTITTVLFRYKIMVLIKLIKSDFFSNPYRWFWVFHYRIRLLEIKIIDRVFII